MDTKDIFKINVCIKLELRDHKAYLLNQNLEQKKCYCCICNIFKNNYTKNLLWANEAHQSIDALKSDYSKMSLSAVTWQSRNLMKKKKKAVSLTISGYKSVLFCCCLWQMMEFSTRYYSLSKCLDLTPWLCLCIYFVLFDT